MVESLPGCAKQTWFIAVDGLVPSYVEMLMGKRLKCLFFNCQVIDLRSKFTATIINMNKSNLSSRLLLIALILLGLYLGKDLLIPFVIALVIWYLLNSLNKLFSRIRINKKSLPGYLLLILSGLTLTLFSYSIAKLVLVNFDNFVVEYPKYHTNFLAMTSKFSSSFDLPISLDELVENANLTSLLSGAVDSSLGFVGTFFLIVLYVIFLLIEQKIVDQKLKQIFKERAEYARFLSIGKKVNESIHTYVSIKTGLCLLAGIISYIVLLIIGVDFAVLWGFLIFMLNYIPIIGAFVGIIFPTLIAIVQFGGYVEPLLVICLLSGIQLIIGNFVEPKILGTRLNLSPLVVIVALTFWGSIWGIAGMFLCVPITVIMMIIFSQFDSTRNIAILLSGGKVVDEKKQ